MIQPLRTLHRWIFLCLAVLLPAIFVAGIMVRPIPLESHTEKRLIALSGSDWDKHLFAVQISVSPSGQTSLTLIQTKPFRAPDLLVYYTDQPPRGEAVPSDAHMLGRWEPASTYPISAFRNRYVLLYSVGHKAVLDTVAVEGRP